MTFYSCVAVKSKRHTLVMFFVFFLFLFFLFCRFRIMILHFEWNLLFDDKKRILQRHSFFKFVRAALFAATRLLQKSPSAIWWSSVEILKLPNQLHVNSNTFMIRGKRKKNLWSSVTTTARVITSADVHFGCYCRRLFIRFWRSCATHTSL